MFLLSTPSPERIQEFLARSSSLPLSYAPVGLATMEGPPVPVTETVAVIGQGQRDFCRAKAALETWKQFDFPWVALHPSGAPVSPGTDVGVLIRHLGFWSLNGCRVMYQVGEAGSPDRFGYAYGTLVTHAEAGEELFEVSLDPATFEVRYRIRAGSWGRSPLAKLGQPVVRVLQARFRRDSIRAMRHALRVNTDRTVP